MAADPYILTPPVIAAPAPADYDGWLALWNGNNGGPVDARVTAQTWARLVDPASPVNGLLIREGDALCGLVHYILHPVTGHLMPACYMQDLYIDPAFRKRGLGRALVEHLALLGRDTGWARLYWLAEASNPAAQALYAHLGVRLDFTFHVMPLRPIT